MIDYRMKCPIGLNAPCRFAERTCLNFILYKRYGLRPKHLIIPLDSGSGRTTLVEYISYLYKRFEVMNFRSGLDDYVEVTFDGTLPQLRQAFASIDSAAVYANEYEGIVAMDISKISEHLNETQYSEFMEKSKRVCEHACVVFFVNACPGKNEERLVQALRDQIDNIELIVVEPYTREDISSFIMARLKDSEIEIKDESKFQEAVYEMVDALAISSIKDAIKITEKIIGLADTTLVDASIDVKNIEVLIKNPTKNV